MRNSLQSSYQMVVVITEMGAEPPFYYSDDGEGEKKLPRLAEKSSYS